MVLLPVIIGGYMVSKRVREEQGNMAGVVSGLIVGAIATVPMLILVILGTTFPNIRNMFVGINSDLMEVLSLGYTANDAPLTGAFILAIIMAFAAVDGAVVAILPDVWRKSVINATTWTLGMGMMSELLDQVFSTFRGYEWMEKDTIKLMLQGGSIKPGFAGIIFVVAFLWPWVMPHIRKPVKASYAASGENDPIDDYVCRLCAHDYLASGVTLARRPFLV